jgi:hypothetical protein
MRRRARRIFRAQRAVIRRTGRHVRVIGAIVVVGLVAIGITVHRMILRLVIKPVPRLVMVGVCRYINTAMFDISGVA